MLTPGSATVPLGKPTITLGASQQSGTLSPSWTKVPYATGYELNVNSKNYDTTSTRYTLSNLSQDTTYHFKERAYRIVNTEKVYGDWSDTVSRSLSSPPVAWPN